VKSRLFRGTGSGMLWLFLTAGGTRIDPDRAGTLAGQAPDGHRVTPVRRGLRERLPLAAVFRQGGASAGGIGAGQKQRRPL
jgi:hypothetical protein